MNKIKKVAMESAKEAGAELLKRYYKFSRTEIKLKSHHEILTKADLAAEKIIIAKIKKNFPDHDFLSEEAGLRGVTSDYQWIIDPLDGTTNFSMHNPIWATSIGVAYKGKIIFGVIFAPFLDELYTAETGKGARLNNKKIKVSKIKREKVLNTFCHSSKKADIAKAIKYYKKQKLLGFDCRQLGSASLELAYVACGRIESIVIPGANSWDVSAGVLLVREAGGRVTDFQNKKWSLKSRDMMASNGVVHRRILDVIS